MTVAAIACGINRRLNLVDPDTLPTVAALRVENDMLRAIVDEVCRRDSRLAADVLRAVSQAPALRSAA